jgi:hypothetical protein
MMLLAAVAVAAGCHDLGRKWDGGPRDGVVDRARDAVVDRASDAGRDAPRDARRDRPADARRDAPRDRGPDALQPDKRPPDKTPPDTCAPFDAFHGPDLGAAPDLGVPACVDDGSKGTLCKQCLPVDDPDCDGFKSGGGSVQDPQPALHNPLLLGESLASDPFKGRWKATPPVVWKKTCALDLDGTYLLEATGCAAPQGYHQLVEAKFAVSKTYGTPVNWQVTLGGENVPVTPSMSCALKAEAGVAGGAAHAHAYACGNGAGTAPLKPIAIPGSFILQMWAYTDSSSGDAAFSCRVLSGDGSAVLDGTSIKCFQQLKFTSSVTLRTKNVQLAVEHIRAYATLNQ